MGPIEAALVDEYERARRAFAEFRCSGDAKADLAEVSLLRVAHEEAQADLAAHVWLCGEVETGAGVYTIGPDGQLRHIPYRSHRPLTEGAWN